MSAAPATRPACAPNCICWPAEPSPPTPPTPLLQHGIPSLAFLRQCSLARRKLERLDSCSAPRGGYIAEAKRVLAAAVHTASEQEAAAVESRCGADSCWLLRLGSREEARVLCNGSIDLALRVDPLTGGGRRVPPMPACPPVPAGAQAPALPPPRSEQPSAARPSHLYCSPYRLTHPACSCSGAIGPLLRYLRDNKHNDAALRAGLHTLSLLVTNSPNRGIIVSFDVSLVIRAALSGAPPPWFGSLSRAPGLLPLIAFAASPSCTPLRLADVTFSNHRKAPLHDCMPSAL